MPYLASDAFEQWIRDRARGLDSEEVEALVQGEYDVDGDYAFADATVQAQFEAWQAASVATSASNDRGNERKESMSDNGFTFDELITWGWFLKHGDLICRKVSDRYFIYRDCGGEVRVAKMRQDVRIEPLPDCDSFDWQPPREPTAMELAKGWLRCIWESRPLDKQWEDAWDRLSGIIAAMEREAAK